MSSGKRKISDYFKKHPEKPSEESSTEQEIISESQ